MSGSTWISLLGWQDLAQTTLISCLLCPDNSSLFRRETFYEFSLRPDFTTTQDANY